MHRELGRELQESTLRHAVIVEGCFDPWPDRSFFLSVRQLALRYGPIFNGNEEPGQMKNIHNIVLFLNQVPRHARKKPDPIPLALYKFIFNK